MAEGQPLSTSARILWGAGTSRTIRAHWALAELGLDYDCRPILPRTGETQTAEFTAINPRQKLPALQERITALRLHGQWIDASIQLTSALGGGYHQTVK